MLENEGQPSIDKSFDEIRAIRPWMKQWLKAYRRNIPNYPDSEYFFARIDLTTALIDPKSIESIGLQPNHVREYKLFNDLIKILNPHKAEILKLSGFYGGVVYSESLTLNIIDLLEERNLLAVRLHGITEERIKVQDLTTKRDKAIRTKIPRSLSFEDMGDL